MKLARKKLKMSFDMHLHMLIIIHKLPTQMTPSLDEPTYDAFNYDILFKNEIIAYEEVFPTLGWSERCPKYYYSHIRSDGIRQAVIALGDFTYDGWSLSKQSFNLSLEHVMVAGKRYSPPLAR